MLRRADRLALLARLFGHVRDGRLADAGMTGLDPLLADERRRIQRLLLILTTGGQAG